MATLNQLLVIKAFFYVSDHWELAAVFLKYPELLEEEIDSVFEEMIGAIRDEGKGVSLENLPILIERHQKLKNVRPILRELIAQQQNENMSKDALQEALAIALDTEAFLDVAYAFINASTGEEITAAFVKYPELLEAEETDHIFVALMDSAIKHGDNESAELFAECLQQLKDIRVKLREAVSQQYSHALILQKAQEEQAAKTAKTDIKLLLTAMQHFLDVSDAKAAYVLFQTYPELLNEEMNPLFEASIAAAQKQCDPKVAKFLKERHRLLKKLRQEARKIFKKDSFHRTRH
ncbi:MAG: hypothetical protein BWK79_12425 [Beggiatoa sp. IS2]|nr:MAG: hypothetical protein BWK79_12425 [Beggiatoa sp. IS2]